MTNEITNQFLLIFTSKLNAIVSNPSLSFQTNTPLFMSDHHYPEKATLRVKINLSKPWIVDSTILVILHYYSMRKTKPFHIILHFSFT